jgi:ribonuclease Z
VQRSNPLHVAAENGTLGMTHRISILAIACLSLALASTAHCQTQIPDFRVTLLGTGAPPPDPNRFGPSTLVEAGGQKLLFDVGRGVPIRLWQVRIPLRDINATFLTHFHSDHVAGVPDVWLSGWLGGPFARRRVPFNIVGPVGTNELMSNLERAFAADVRIRVADEGYPVEGVKYVAREFDKEEIVYENSGVRVTAFVVDHGEHIKPAYGYRIDFDGRAVVISGDTRYNENVIKYATGVDLLIHEVAAVRPELLADAQVKRVMDHHTSPQDVGRVFSRAKPKLGAYTHLVLLARGNVAPLTPDELLTQTRETYEGPVAVGEDLMTFDIGKSGVTIQRRMPKG